MGLLSKALAPPSAHSLKKTDFFADIKDRIDGAMFERELDDVEQWLDDNDHLYPAAWRESFADMIELQRDAIRSEDVGVILRDRFDF